MSSASISACFSSSLIYLCLKISNRSADYVSFLSESVLECGFALWEALESSHSRLSCLICSLKTFSCFSSFYSKQRTLSLPFLIYETSDNFVVSCSFSLIYSNCSSLFLSALSSLILDSASAISIPYYFSTSSNFCRTLSKWILSCYSTLICILISASNFCNCFSCSLARSICELEPLERFARKLFSH